jgi:hypothetical protein
MLRRWRPQAVATKEVAIQALKPGPHACSLAFDPPERPTFVLRSTIEPSASIAASNPEQKPRRSGLGSRRGSQWQLVTSQEDNRGGQSPWRRHILSLPHHYGPKTDRRTATARVMSHNVQRVRLLPVECHWCVANIDLVGGSAIGSEATSTNKKRERKPMTLEQMELALARIDVMIGFLQRRVTEGTHRQGL